MQESLEGSHTPGLNGSRYMNIYARFHHARQEMEGEPPLLPSAGRCPLHERILCLQGDFLALFPSPSLPEHYQTPRAMNCREHDEGNNSGIVVIDTTETEGISAQQVFGQGGQRQQQPLWSQQTEKAAAAKKTRQVIETAKRDKCSEE